MPKQKIIIDSFKLDHINMPAPQVRKAGIQTGPLGDTISKFDLRFIKPNTECMPNAGLHTLEHLLATYLREHIDNIIDLSPMGCRTGFYLSLWGDIKPTAVQTALISSLHQVVKTKWEDVPGTSEAECGNYKDHSLESAQKIARQVLEGFEIR